MAEPAANNPICKPVAPRRAAYTLRKLMADPLSTPNQAMSKYKWRKLARYCSGTGVV